MSKINPQMIFNIVLSELSTAVKNIHAEKFSEESLYIENFLIGIKKKLARIIYSKIENGVVITPSQEKIDLIFNYLNSEHLDSPLSQLKNEHINFRKMYNPELFLNIWKQAINPSSCDSMLMIVLKYESRFKNKLLGTLNLVIDTDFMISKLKNPLFLDERSYAISVEDFIQTKTRRGYPVNLMVDVEMSLNYQSSINTNSPKLPNSMSTNSLNTSWGSKSGYSSLFGSGATLTSRDNSPSPHQDSWYVDTESLTSYEDFSSIDASSGQSVYMAINNKINQIDHRSSPMYI